MPCRHDAVLAVEFRAFGKQVNIVFFQILIRRVVGDHIDRIGQNAPDGKAGELLAALRDAAVLQKILVGLAERAGRHEYLEDRLDQLNFLRNGFELVGLAFLAVHGHAGFALGSIARGRRAAQPAPGLGQLVHIVPDALGDGLPLQLGEHGRNVHHSPAHGGGRVELLADGDEVNVPVAQVLDELGKVPDVAADAVEAVDQHIFRRFLAKVHGDVLAAQLDLVLDALALAGEFGLARVDDILLYSCPIPRNYAMPLFSFNNAVFHIRRICSLIKNDYQRQQKYPPECLAFRGTQNTVSKPNDRKRLFDHVRFNN